MVFQMGEKQLYPENKRTYDNYQFIDGTFRLCSESIEFGIGGLHNSCSRIALDFHGL